MPDRDRKKPLGTYRDKRAPGVTNEPFGDEQSSSASSKTMTGAFVVHLHDATRRHYDVRLEVGGVLLSFAVPKGPSLDPQERLLAVRTEEHPIEYLDFEDVIPEGQYGAGPMIVWDRGFVSYFEGPAEDELAQGKLHVELRGMKLRGRFAFVRMAKGESGNEYLFFKKQDDAADPKRKIVEEMPRSILSGLTVEEMLRRDEIAGVHHRFALTLGAKEDGALIAELVAAKESPLVTPLTKELEWTPRIYDADLDGVRVLAIRDGDVVTIRSWSGGRSSGAAENIEAFYPDVVRALRSLPVTKIAIDGELVAFDPTGRPNMNLLAERVAKIAKGEALRVAAMTPVVLVCKDILAIGDLDTRMLALEDRRHLLTEMLAPVGFLRAASPLEGDEARVLATCAELGIASVVAKAKGSAYSNTAIGTKGDAAKGKHSPWTHLSTGLGARLRVVVDHHAEDASVALRRVTITNRDKVFWPANPDDGRDGPFTKGDLIDYYSAVAETLLPYLKDRPVILVRYPDGIDGKSFFQWNVPVGMPPWIRTMTMHELDDFRAVISSPTSPMSSPRSSGSSSSSKPTSRPNSVKTPKRVFLVDDASTLVYIANLGCIPLHVLASRAPDLTKADFLTIDFDVKQSELRHAITLACTLHTILDEIGLPSFPKTSGQTGLHVLVPLGGQSFDTARALADLLGRLLVDRHPDIATMDRVVNRRGEKVYVDTGQTGTSRAIVAPYSVRAVKGATVSTPLTWDEVDKDLDPRALTIKTVPARLAKRGDLLKGLLGGQPNVVRAVAKLADIVPPRASLVPTPGK